MIHSLHLKMTVTFVYADQEQQQQQQQQQRCSYVRNIKRALLFDSIDTCNYVIYSVCCG